MTPEKNTQETKEIEKLVDEKKSRMVFVFQQGEQIYSIPPTSVIEVIGQIQATYVPFTPMWLHGVINVRGKIIPVMDLSVYFGLQKSDKKSERSRLIIIDINGDFLAVYADQIIGVETINEKQIEQPLSNLPDGLIKYCTSQFRMNNRLVYALDLQLLKEEAGQGIETEPM